MNTMTVTKYYKYFALWNICTEYNTQKSLTQKQRCYSNVDSM